MAAGLLLEPNLHLDVWLFLAAHSVFPIIQLIGLNNWAFMVLTLSVSLQMSLNYSECDVSGLY